MAALGEPRTHASIDSNYVFIHTSNKRKSSLCHGLLFHIRVANVTSDIFQISPRIIVKVVMTVSCPGALLSGFLWL